MARIDWPTVLDAARVVVRSYETPVTLRQLHYRLVSMPELGYPNTLNAYKQLSSRTAEHRRAGTFPRLHDRTRVVHRPAAWSSPSQAYLALCRQYRVDRTRGQVHNLYVAVEKAGLVAQLEDWFGALGVPILALSGYSSQSFVDDVIADVERDGRPAVMLYGGDFDPSGEDIDRDFAARTDCWAKVVRVALDAEQVETMGLPPAMGKATDSRAGAFVARHGRLVQVELDAVPPDVLEGLYRDAIGAWWDESEFDAVLDDEQHDLERLSALAALL